MPDHAARPILAEPDPRRAGPTLPGPTLPGPTLPGPTPSTLEVTVRYFAAARAATGVDGEQIGVPSGSRLSDVAALLGERHGPALARVLEVSTFLLDEVSTPRDRALPGAGTVTVDVLPPFAGG